MATPRATPRSRRAWHSWWRRSPSPPGWSAPVTRSGSSRRRCWWASKPASRSTWRARNSPSSSGSKDRMAISGSARATSSAILETRIRRLSSSAASRSPRSSRGKLWLKNRPVAFLVVVSSIVAARLLNLEAAGVTLLGDVPQGLPSLGLPHVGRLELNDTVAAGARQLRARRRRDVGHRPHVRAEARQPLRRQPGAPGAWRRQSAVGTRPRVPGQRRHVAITRQRERRRPHAASRGWSPRSSRSSSCCSRPASCGICRSRCSRRSCSPPS